MATSNFSVILLFLSITVNVAFATFPAQSIASDQINFWSKNVVNSMPKSLVSKLSPLSKQDCDSVATSLVSKSYVSFDEKFCAAANLACSPLQSAIAPKAKVYNVYPKFKQPLGMQNAHKASRKHSGEADPNSFFRILALQNGKMVKLPDLSDHYPSRKFLPSQIASKISITSSIDLQKIFPNSFISPASRETMEMSISYCTSPNLKGEIKSCPKSLENMIEFSKRALKVTKLMSLSSESTKGSKKEVEIANLKQLKVKEVVSCHEVFFPFATYFCHLLSSTRLYVVDVVEPETKAHINKIMAVCHMDTSKWPADHVSFKILKMLPGQGEACHWFGSVDLAWIGM